MKKTIVISLIVSNLLFGASTVTNMETTYTNKINTGSTIDNSTVHQGKTSIHSSTVEDVELKSGTVGNLINNAQISDSSHVDQAVFLVNATADDKTARVGVVDESTDMDIKVTSDNTIQDSKINKGIIKQNYISTEDSTVNAMTIVQTNSIDNTDTDNDIATDTDHPYNTNNATLSQGEFTFKNGAEVKNLTQEGTNNKITGSRAENATMSQNSITVDASTIDNFKNTHGGDTDAPTNLIENVDLSGTEGVEDGSIIQNRALFTEEADVTNSETIQSNTVSGTTIEKVNIVQGDTQVAGSTVQDFDTTFTNSISGGTIKSTDDVIRTVEQGVLIVGGTGTKVTDIPWGDDEDNAASAEDDANNVDITATNTLSDSTLSDSSLIQSKTTINGDATVDGFEVDQTNIISKLDASDAEDSTATRATISQADTLITGGSVSTLIQNITNNIDSSQLTDATLSQGDTSITGDSTVTTLTLGTKDSKIDNDVTSSDITGESSDNKSTLSQAKTTIKGSTVTNVTILQTNVVDSSSITGGSTVTQGETTISDESLSDVTLDS
jgi:hypothetical protein